MVWFGLRLSNENTLACACAIADTVNSMDKTITINVFSCVSDIM